MSDETRGNIKFAVGLICILIVVAIVMKATGKMPDNKKEKVATTSTATEVTTENTNQETGEEKLILPVGVEGVDNPEDYLTGRIKIPRVIEPNEEGIVVITEPLALLNKKAETPEERARIAVESSEKYGIEVMDAYGNEDGSVTFIYDEYNWELRVQREETIADNWIDTLHCKASISDDYTHLIIYIDETTDPIFEYACDGIIIESVMIALQIYTGVEYTDWHVTMTTVYEKTGEVMLEHTFGSGGDGDLDITDEDWIEMFENLENPPQLQLEQP